MDKQQVKNYLDLVLAMTEKELRVRYKNTLFGFLWVFINPIFQMLVIGFIFRFFIKENIENYYLYLLAGLLVWNFFSLSLTKATPSIVNERALIKKSKFPRSVIPLSIILSNFVHLLLAFILLIIPVVFFNTLSKLWFFQISLCFILLFFVTTGFSLLTSSLDVYYRDVNFFVQAILILWFYATPIIYSIYIIPSRYIWFWRLNPLTATVQLFQAAIAEAPMPGLLTIVSNIIITLIIIVLGILIFRKESKNFDDWI